MTELCDCTSHAILTLLETADISKALALPFARCGGIAFTFAPPICIPPFSLLPIVRGIIVTIRREIHLVPVTFVIAEDIIAGIHYSSQ